MINNPRNCPRSLTQLSKTGKEIRRCIKRYLARHLYRTLSNA